MKIAEVKNFIISKKREHLDNKTQFYGRHKQKALR